MEKVVKEKEKMYQKWLAIGDPDDRKSYCRMRYIVKKEVVKEK